LSYSLRPYVAEVLDQSITQSCVANSVAQAIRIVQTRALGQPARLLSRLFAYFNARAFEGEQRVDEGTFIRDAMRGIAKFGFCPESEWAFDPGEVNTQPPWNAYRSAADQRMVTGYYKITSSGSQRLEDVKRAISSGYPVVFGTQVTEAFTEFVGKKVFDAPGIGEPIAGGHAMVLCEYDDVSLRGPNSWSSGWGDGGWFAFKPEVISWIGSSDFTVIEIAPEFLEAA